MAFIDVGEIAGLGEKFEYMAYLFRRFNFPNKPRGGATSSERDYWNAASSLYGLNSRELDDIAQKSLDEWNLQIDSSQNEESDSFYLMEFTRRLNAAITDEMLPAFSSAQTLNQTEDHNDSGK